MDQGSAMSPLSVGQCEFMERADRNTMERAHRGKSLHTATHAIPKARSEPPSYGDVSRRGTRRR